MTDLPPADPALGADHARYWDHRVCGWVRSPDPPEHDRTAPAAVEVLRGVASGALRRRTTEASR